MTVKPPFFSMQAISQAVLAPLGAGHTGPLLKLGSQLQPPPFFWPPWPPKASQRSIPTAADQRHNLPAKSRCLYLSYHVASESKARRKAGLQHKMNMLLGGIKCGSHGTCSISLQALLPVLTRLPDKSLVLISQIPPNLV